MNALDYLEETLAQWREENRRAYEALRAELLEALEWDGMGWPAPVHTLRVMTSEEIEACRNTA